MKATANPKRVLKTACRYNAKDIIDSAVETGMDLSGTIYEVPYSIFRQGVGTVLSMKDAVKKELGLNPADHPQGLLILRSATFPRPNPRDRWRHFHTLSPERAAQWCRAVSVALRNPEQYRIVKVLAKQRNPQDASQEMYEAFHGRPSTEEIVVEREVHEHEHLAGLGDLVEVWIETPTGFLAKIRFPEEDRPILSSNEAGTQLYIEGGDQQIDLKSLNMDGKDWVKDKMVLGTFAPPQGKRRYNIVYLTQKKFDQFEDIEYQHDLGEPDADEPKGNRREAPVLTYEPINQQLFIEGGQYYIRQPLVGVSPGIEN